MNKVMLMGRFTRDPELRTTPQGTSVVSFSLAVNRRYVKGEERKADFINCVAWRHTAEFIKSYFKKGDPIIVEGSIQTRTWDGTDGQKHYATEVQISEAMFVESRKSQDSSQSYGDSLSQDSSSLPAEFTPTIADDDLPF